MSSYITRYFLTLEGVGTFEVEKEKWVKAERTAGFRPRYGASDSEPCTGGFSSGLVSGSIKREKVELPKDQAAPINVGLVVNRGNGAELEVF